MNTCGLTRRQFGHALAVAAAFGLIERQTLAGLLPEHPRSLTYLAQRTASAEGNWELKKIEGKVPRELNGMLIRTAPGQKEIFGTKLKHLFDGDAYLSKFTFQAVGGGRSALLHDRLKRGEYFDGEASQTVVQEREMGMEGENREFLAALAEGRPPATGWRDGLRATAMVRAAFRAAETRMAQPLTLPTNR